MSFDDIDTRFHLRRSAHSAGPFLVDRFVGRLAANVWSVAWWFCGSVCSTVFLWVLCAGRACFGTVTGCAETRNRSLISASVGRRSLGCLVCRLSVGWLVGSLSLVAPSARKGVSWWALVSLGGALGAEKGLRSTLCDPQRALRSHPGDPKGSSDDPRRCQGEKG